MRASSARSPRKRRRAAAPALPPDLSASAVRYLGSLSGVDGCSLFLFAPGDRISLALAHGDAALRALSVAQGLPRGESTRLLDAAALHPSLRRRGIRWLLWVPLRASKGSPGALCLTRRDSSPFPAATVSLCESMASGLVAALQGGNMMELLLRAKVALEKTFDAMPDLVALLDRDGRITRLNQTMAERAGQPLRTLIGEDFAERFPFCRDWLVRTRRVPPPQRTEWAELSDLERGVCYEVKLLDIEMPLPGMGEQAVFMRDVTQQREMARRVIAFERRAAAGDLLTGVAHEVRNPLAAIQAATQALQRLPLPDVENVALLGVIRRQVDRLGALMRDLLHVGRPSAAPAPEAVDVRALCEAVIRSWPQGQAERRRVRLQAGAGRKLWVRAEEARLEQVLLNLLDNAAHNSRAGAPIGVELSLTGGMVVVRVIDQGTGITPEVQSHVFEPFFTTRPEGTGLGLALVKTIVESYGGSVTVFNNVPPPGCTFEVHLPSTDGGV